MYFCVRSDEWRMVDGTGSRYQSSSTTSVSSAWGKGPALLCWCTTPEQPSSSSFLVLQDNAGTGTSSLSVHSVVSPWATRSRPTKNNKNAFSLDNNNNYKNGIGIASLLSSLQITITITRMVLVLLLSLAVCSLSWRLFLLLDDHNDNSTAEEED